MSLRAGKPVKQRAKSPSHAEFEALLGALEAGPQSLGTLRRLHGLQPTLCGRLVAAHPETFIAFEQAGKPYCKLLIDPISAAMSAPETIEESPEPPEEDPLQEFPVPEASNPSDSESSALETPIDSRLIADREKLKTILGGFVRYSSWIEEFQNFPFERVKEIDRAFPGFLEIQPSELGQKYVFKVALRTDPPPTPIVTESSPAPAPKERFVSISELPADQLAMMRWKPCARRGVTNPLALQHRKRNPLVKL